MERRNTAFITPLAESPTGHCAKRWYEKTMRKKGPSVHTSAYQKKGPSVCSLPAEGGQTTDPRLRRGACGP